MNFLDVLQRERDIEIKKHRTINGVRCKNCKGKIRKIKNDFKYKKECKTCWKCKWDNRKYDYINRENIYACDEKGKWKKVKYYDKIEEMWRKKV